MNEYTKQALSTLKQVNQTSQKEEVSEEQVNQEDTSTWSHHDKYAMVKEAWVLPALLGAGAYAVGSQVPWRRVGSSIAGGFRGAAKGIGDAWAGSAPAAAVAAPAAFDQNLFNEAWERANRPKKPGPKRRRNSPQKRKEKIDRQYATYKDQLI